MEERYAREKQRELEASMRKAAKVGCMLPNNARACGRVGLKADCTTCGWNPKVYAKRRKQFLKENRT